MYTLEEILRQREERLGKDHLAVQMLRNQIIAEQSGKNFRELYSEITELEESVISSIPERFRTLDPNSVAYKLAQEMANSLNETVAEREIARNRKED